MRIITLALATITVVISTFTMSPGAHAATAPSAGTHKAGVTMKWENMGGSKSVLFTATRTTKVQVWRNDNGWHKFATVRVTSRGLILSNSYGMGTPLTIFRFKVLR